MLPTGDSDDVDGAFTPHTVTDSLTGGGENNNFNFGYQQLNAIGDYVWYDIDGDGVQDEGELPLENVLVTLTGDFDADGDIDSLTVSTDENGYYLFDSNVITSNIAPGDYVVSVVLPPTLQGVEQTYDSDGLATPYSSTLTIGAGEVNLDQDFGFTGTGSIGDTVWYDINDNGQLDAGEYGLSGVEITLEGDLTGDGIINTLTTTTGPDGTYLFDNLVEGDYTISVDVSSLPEGSVQTYDYDGFTDSPNVSSVFLPAGTQHLDQDFGYKGTGTIGDTVWFDLDANGVVDQGESGIGGVTVTLTGDLNNDGVADESIDVVTDSNGMYSFNNLFSGDYTLSIDSTSLPPNLAQVFDADGNLDNRTTVQLGLGETNYDLDFGYRVPAPTESITPGEPTTPSPGQPFTSYDPLFRSYVENGDESDVQDFIETRRDKPVFQEPLLPVSPIYTGHAEPGTSLRINLSDAQGNFIGSQLVMADTGGNWLANFSGTLMYDMPHDIEIQQDLSLYNASSAGGFNLRTYFMPALSMSPFTTPELTIDSIFATRPFAILDSIGEHYNQGTNLAWDDFYDYEYKAVSTNPAQSTL